MSLRRYKHFFWFVAVGLIAPRVGNAQGFGFQATLDSPPQVVSGYDNISHAFSASLYPKSQPLIWPQLDRKPVLKNASFEDSSLTFDTRYYGDYSLVPVTVDAKQFLAYNARRNTEDRWLTTIQKGQQSSQGQAGRAGLSIGVALPKRLESVFGEGGGNLRVSGYRRISFSGRSQWNDAASSDLYRQSKFPALQMEQSYQFNIEGTIGSKISVKVSEDSQTDIPLANRLIIRYKGSDDDILKSVEAGNTTLDLPNTRFVGYSSRIQGLFGFKAAAQVGHLKLTGIMSQEKGSSERSTISATGEDNPTRFRDCDYQDNRIFDLGYPGELAKEDSVIQVYAFESINTQQTENSNQPWALMMINPLDPNEDTTKAKLQVQPIDPSMYTFYNELAADKHYIVFNSPRSNSYAIGIAMTYIDVKSRDTTKVGNVDGTSLVLKMLRDIGDKYNRSNPTWRLMWRNVYQVPRGMQVNDLNLRIFKGLAGTEGTSACREDQLSAGGQGQGKYIAILGLDQYNTQGQKIPDDKLDELLSVYNPDWGLIIFPSRTPFNTDTTFTDATGKTTVPLTERVSQLYEYDSPTDRTKNSKYYFQISSGQGGSSVINLNKANIIEGSERVTLNGRLLNRGTDYNIEYSFGRVTLLTPDANDPNANISVDFEYAPFLAIQKKSLMGMRAEYEFSDDFRLGSTVLYKSDKAQDRKPRVGQETSVMTVMDFDGRFKVTPNFLTKAVNALPLVTTEAPSSLTLTGEIAQSRPNPNVNGDAYIDDFESALEQMNLPMTRTAWSMASKPPILGPEFRRSKMLWHNPIGGLIVDSVYDRQSQQGQGTMSYMRLIFRPDTLNSSSWSGITTYIGPNRIDPSRVRLFEIRAKGDRGKIHFDFGSISEDIYGDAKEHTEDGLCSGGIKNGVVDDCEDVGLDLLPDDSEVTILPDSLDPGVMDTIKYNASTNPDPAGDNWYFEGQGKLPVPEATANSSKFKSDIMNPNSPIYYDWLNGTDGNIKDPAVIGRPDDEKLNPNGYFNTSDAYFSYSIDLSNDSLVVPNSERNGWKTYRIAIRDSSLLDGIVRMNTSDSVRWSNISHVRVWFENDDPHMPSGQQFDTVNIAAWYFVQSNWQDTLRLDSSRVHRPDLQTSKFRVASVSTEDHTFTPPPGVTPYTDPSTNVAEPQRGMAMIYESMQPGDTGIAIKRLVTADSYTGYRRLRMWVHGDDNLNPVSDSLEMFFRLGIDSANYYEFRTWLRSGWDPQNEVDIDFNEITALKDAALRSLKSGIGTVDTTSGNYHVCGRPSINQIVYLATGIVNRGSQPINGQVWVDELRVTDVRRDVGTAARIDVQGNMADLINYQASYQTKDAYFRGLSSATRGGSTDNLGGGATQTSNSYSVTMSLGKFLPRSWNANLPVAYSYSKNVSVPLLRTGTDIVLAPDVRDEEKSVGESRSFSVSESVRRKGSNPLFNLLLNRQTMRFSYGRSSATSVTTPYSFGENYNIAGDFDMGWSEPPTLPIFFWTKPIPILKSIKGTKLGLYPTSWRWTGTFNRTLSLSDDVNLRRNSSLSRQFNGGTNLQYNLFQNLAISYSYNTVRDMSNPDDVNLALKNLKVGLETSYSQSVSGTYTPKLVKFFTTALSYSGSYSDTYERTSKSRKSDMSRTWAINGSFNHLALLGSSRRTGPSRQIYMETRPTVKSLRDTTKQAQEPKQTKKSDGKPFYQPAVDLLRLMFGWIDPIGYKYQSAYNNSLPGMLDRPSFFYRLGLARTADVPLTIETRTQTSGAGDGLDLSSGFTLLGGVRTDVRFRRTSQRDLIKQGTRMRTTTTVWPDLGIRINRFKKLPLLKNIVNKFIDVFAPQTAYTRRNVEQFNVDGGFALLQTLSVDQSPFLSVNFKLFRSMSLSGSYSKGYTEEHRFSSTTGQIQTGSKSWKKSIAVTTRYAFSAPGGIPIPLFGKLKFKSTMTIDLAIRQSSSRSEGSSGGGPYLVQGDKSDFSVTPVIGYQFSQQMKGGLQAVWQDTNDNLQGRKSHVRQLQIWAEIRF